MQSTTGAGFSSGQSQFNQQNVTSSSSEPTGAQMPPAPAAGQMPPAQTSAKELNAATLCRFGQETVQEILGRAQELFQILRLVQVEI